jgi:hypothetical protein
LLGGPEAWQINDEGIYAEPERVIGAASVLGSESAREVWHGRPGGLERVLPVADDGLMACEIVDVWT